MLSVVETPVAAHTDYPDSIMPIDGEALMLAMLQYDNARVDQVADVLTGADFADPLYGRIYDTMVQLVSAGHQATPISIDGLMQADEAYQRYDGRNFLIQLVKQASAALLIRPREQADHIIDCARRRRLIDASRNVINQASDRGVALPVLVDETDAALVAAIEQRNASTDDSLFDSIGRALDRIDRIKAADGAVGARTGIDELDRLVGGFEAGQLVIVAGRPGMGKTAVACSLSLGLARNGNGVMFLSLEMRSEELGMRMVSDLCCRRRGSWVPFNAIVEASVDDAQLETMRQARQAIGSWPLRIYDFSSATVSRMALAIRRTKRRMAAQGQELKVVVIDYLQLLHADNRKASAYEAVSEISRSLKAIAKEMGVTIIALAQLSRAVEQREDKRPQLSDLRDSGQIEQDADTVLFLYREEYYLGNKPKKGMEADWQARKDAVAGQLTVICAKRRNGSTGDANLTYLPIYQAVRGSDWRSS